MFQLVLSILCLIILPIQVAYGNGCRVFSRGSSTLEISWKDVRSGLSVGAAGNPVIVVKPSKTTELVDLFDRAHIWNLVDHLSVNEIAVVQVSKNRIVIFAGGKGYELDFAVAKAMGESMVLRWSRKGPERERFEEKARHEGDWDRLDFADVFIGAYEMAATFFRLAAQSTLRGYVLKLEQMSYESLIARLESGELPTIEDFRSAKNVSRLRIQGARRLLIEMGVPLSGAAAAILFLAF